MRTPRVTRRPHPARSCCCPTVRPRSAGRPPRAVEAAAAANVPVFTIAFGTPEGTITDPISGETVPVAVQPGPLADVAEATGGSAYEAATSNELADAYDRIRDTLGETLGQEIETVTELTWRWAAIALALLAAAWAAALWWLRGMLDIDRRFSRTRGVRGAPSGTENLRCAENLGWGSVSRSSGAASPPS